MWLQDATKATFMNDSVIVDNGNYAEYDDATKHKKGPEKDASVHQDQQEIVKEVKSDSCKADQQHGSSGHQH